MASSLPSPSLPRKLLRYMSSRLGALHRSQLLVQPMKPVAVSATVAAAAYYQEPARGRHGDGIAADGDAAARVTSGSNAAAAGRMPPVSSAEESVAKGRPGDATAGRGAGGRSAELALASMAKIKKTPKEGKGHYQKTLVFRVLFFAVCNISGTRQTHCLPCVYQKTHDKYKTHGKHNIYRVPKYKVHSKKNTQ